jgi:hypothetical protein
LKGGEKDMDKKVLTYIMSAFFILVGLLGFINDPVMGLFEVDAMHNFVHLGSGILGIALANQKDGPALYGKIMTIAYGLVMVLGFMMPDQKILGIMETNMADNLLHLVLTAAFVYLGFVTVKNKRGAAVA